MKKIGNKGITRRLFSVGLVCTILISLLPLPGNIVQATLHPSATCNANPDNTHYYVQELVSDKAANIVVYTTNGSEATYNSIGLPEAIRNSPSKAPGTWWYLDNTVLTLCTGTHGHTHNNWSTECSKNDSTHWHACLESGCDQKKDEAAHSYTSYSATDNVLTASCVCGKSITLTLTASSANYSGIDNLSAFNAATGKSINTSDVIIYKVSAANTTTGGTKVEGAPSEDGYYYASLTVEGKTAVKAFTIGNPKPEAGGISDNDKVPGNFNHDTKQETDNLAGSKLNTKVDDLFSRVLTPEEQAEVKSEGVKANVWLEVNPEKATNISASDAEKIKNATPAGYTIPSNGYLDINLWKKIGDRAATTVPNLSGKVSITVKVPADLQKSGRSYRIIRLHEGIAEALATNQDSNFNLTFETDGFSTYAIAYSDNAATAPASSTSPKTGEANSNYLILLICLAALSLLGLGTWRKRA